MPADVADHVAAVALLGKPDQQFMQAIDSPPVTVGPLYAAKTIELCAPGDPICSDGDDGAAHTSYTKIGMVDQAATYAAGRGLTRPAYSGLTMSSVAVHGISASRLGRCTPCCSRAPSHCGCDRRIRSATAGCGRP